MEKVRAKFVCNSLIPTDGDQTVMNATAVVSGSEENKSFSRWTPAGNSSLVISNETPTASFFKQGKEFYLDITEAGVSAYVAGDADLNFGDAIQALKKGKRVARAGWNGKGMFVFMRPDDELHIDMVIDKVKSLPQSVKDYYLQDVTLDDKRVFPADENDKVLFTAYLCMKAADGTIVNGWLASQTDMLAEDWCVLD